MCRMSDTLTGVNMKTTEKPITAEQSRASRFKLALSQAEVVQKSGLPSHKLKQFEAGRFSPDLAFLQELAAFYTGLGVDLADERLLPSTAPAAKPGAEMVRPEPMHRPHFYIGDMVTQELLDKCLERMHSNDELITAILEKGLRTGMMGDFSDETKQENEELFGAMAEGYLIFRLLQGNPLVPPGQAVANPRTHAEMLRNFFSQSPVAVLDQVEDLSDELAGEIVK